MVFGVNMVVRVVSFFFGGVEEWDVFGGIVFCFDGCCGIVRYGCVLVFVVLNYV